MPDKFGMAVVATLAGIGACTMFVGVGLIIMLFVFVIIDKQHERKRKAKTIEELKVKWERVPARRH